MALRRLSLPCGNWVDFLDTQPGPQLRGGGDIRYKAAGAVFGEGETNARRESCSYPTFPPPAASPPGRGLLPQDFYAGL